MDKQTKKASSVPTPRAKDERKPTTEKANDLNVQELEERIAPSGGIPKLGA
jgi:hypothetical protein